MRLFFVSIALLFGLQTSAAAADTSAPMELTMTSEAVYLALGQAHRNSPKGGKTRNAIEMVALAVLDDNHIDATERQLLQALATGSPELIAIAPPSSMSGRVTLQFVNRIPAELREQLTQLQPTSGEWAYLDAIWRQIPRKSPFPDLLEQYQAGPEQQQRLKQFLATSLGHYWGQSSVATGYQPMAGFAQQLGAHYKRLDASQQTAVDGMLQSTLAVMNAQLPATTFGPLEWPLLRNLMMQGNN